MRYPILAALALTAPPAMAAPAPAERAYQELLAVDRGFAEGAAGKDLVTALATMFDRDAVLVSGGSAVLVRGAAAIRERLAANPQNATSSVEWSPIGGGISADGTQGFTYGGMTVRPRDGAPILQKYLAYWVRRPEGWRVFAYKRSGRTGTGALTPAPAIIGRGPRRTDDHGATLKASEQAFSDEAQTIGLRAAFVKWGRPDAINLGAADTIAVGAQAIGEGVAGPEPGSPVAWHADEVMVAASGDMGVTYGLLRFKSPPEGQPATIPFLTVWARPRSGDPWRYVAE